MKALEPGSMEGRLVSWMVRVCGKGKERDEGAKKAPGVWEES